MIAHEWFYKIGRKIRKPRSLTEFGRLLLYLDDCCQFSFSACFLNGLIT